MAQLRATCAFNVLAAPYIIDMGNVTRSKISAKVSYLTLWFAHTVAGRPETEWERLLHHLGEVASGAAVLGAKFSAVDIAGIAGLLHDLGKYKPEFQAHLRKPGRVDHSTAGACFASGLGHAGRLVAHVVAGHHAGLQDNLLKRHGRLEKENQVVASVLGAARSDGVTLPTAVPFPALSFDHEALGFQFAFLVRMLLSCLVDADRAAAARFDAESNNVSLPVRDIVSIATLEHALAMWMAARAPAKRPLDKLRDEVLRHVLAQADGPQGVFTLTVPTGGGKTLTSLAFALAHARRHGLDRVIVVIPFTSVIEQTADVYRQVLGAYGDQVLEHHSAFDMEDELRRERIGPDALRLSMEDWAPRIVVTTAVQFFESLFSNRPSRCRKLHNITRSVVVLDEAQTMPLMLLRPCVAALKELARNYGSSIVLCTATQPALTSPTTCSDNGFVGGFVSPVELAPDVPRLFAALQRTIVRDIGEQTDAELAQRLAAFPQSLCIVNLRAHARDLFGSIKHLPGARHLSTCMHAAHRAQALAEIRADLLDGRPCRVISTSLIEAGVDVDFPLVLRAEAGLDQIAQAAGRCNREGRHTAEDSEVLIFRSPSYQVIQVLRANAEAGAEMLRMHKDPLAPPAMQAFFRMLYWRKGKEALDSGQVMKCCDEAKRTLDFPFATIAKAMRFIDETMVPIIVPVGDGAAMVVGLLDSLRHGAGVSGVARQIQRYTVGVPRVVRGRLLADGLAECVRPDLFEDQFVVLLHLELYRPDVGMEWSDPMFAG